MQLKFSKMHGLGNDFVVLEQVSRDFDLSPKRIAQLSDRRTGIGFDQLLIAALPTRPDADFRYQIYNADGSVAEQCGNGARCFARYVVDRKLTTKRSLVLETNTGLITTSLLPSGQVEINMGAPRLDCDDVPFIPALALPKSDAPKHNLPEPAHQTKPLNGNDNYSQCVSVDDCVARFTPVSMGNPHAVVQVDNVRDAPLDTVGQQIAHHPSFPAGVNVGFAQIVDRKFMRLRVLERGVGETRACGTGACAAAVAGILAGCLDSKVKVALPGGNLTIVWQGIGEPVKMTGAATLVYNGEFKA